MRAVPSPMVVIAPVVVGLGLLSAGLASAAITAFAAKGTVKGWVERIIRRVSGHEGDYESINPNIDKAGLSFGMLQWSQATGALGTLLAEMNAADPARFRAAFGPDSPALLASTARGSLDPVGGAVLWAEPWLSRFKAVGHDPFWQRVQYATAEHGPYFQGALAVASRMGVQTERSMALFLDASVQQGPASALAVASRTVDAFKAQGATAVAYQTLLTAYAVNCAELYRSKTDPGTYSNPRLQWAPVANEWHLFAGEFDLYKNVLRRRLGIVNDPDLGDHPVSVTSTP